MSSSIFHSTLLGAMFLLLSFAFEAKAQEHSDGGRRPVKARDSLGSYGCDSRKGLTEDIARRWFGDNVGALEKCFQSKDSASDAKSRRLRVSLSIESSSGRIREIKFSGGDIAPEFQSCIERALIDLSFPICENKTDKRIAFSALLYLEKDEKKSRHRPVSDVESQKVESSKRKEEPVRFEYKNPQNHKTFSFQTPAALSPLDQRLVITVDRIENPKVSEEKICPGALVIDYADPAGPCRSLDDFYEEQMLGVVQLNIKSPNPKLVVYEKVDAQAESGDDIFANRLFCQTPCSRLVDGRDGRSFYFGGPGISPSESFRIDNTNGELHFNVSPGSRALATVGHLAGIMGSLVFAYKALPLASKELSPDRRNWLIGSALTVALGVYLHLSNRTTWSLETKAEEDWAELKPEENRAEAKPEDGWDSTRRPVVPGEHSAEFDESEPGPVSYELRHQKDERAIRVITTDPALEWYKRDEISPDVDSDQMSKDGKQICKGLLAQDLPGECYSLSDLYKERVRGIIRLSLKSKNPELQLFEKFEAKTERGVDLLGHRVLCQAPCDKIIDARNGRSFYLSGPGIVESEVFRLDNQSGGIRLDVSPGSKLQGTLGLYSMIISSFIGTYHMIPIVLERNTALITKERSIWLLGSGVSAVLGLLLFNNSQTTYSASTTSP